MKKLDTSKLVVRGTEWISQMAILNLTWLLFSLPIVTLIPATDALFEIIHNRNLKEPSGSAFRLFAQTFRKNFKRSYKFGLPIFIIGAVFVVDILFLRSVLLSAAWFQIFKYALYTLSVVFLLVVLFGYPLSKRIQTTTWQGLLMGLMMGAGHPLISLGLLGSLVALGLAFLRWPALLLFFSASGIAWLADKAVSLALSKSQKNSFHKK